MDFSQMWMNKLPAPQTLGATPEENAVLELESAGYAQARVTVNEAMGDGYRVTREGTALCVEGGRTGVLYGAYAVLLGGLTGKNLPEGVQRPRYGLRMLNCWDNVGGDVERGYSGRSLFFRDNKLCWDPERVRLLGRMLASVGINVICINNVNVHEPAQQLIEGWLEELQMLAAAFRCYGVRLMLSVDFSRPLAHGVHTADPLDERVQDWWNRQAAKVYEAIPDLAGFLVKADSEHRPGPFTYGRNHAEGANMLARAVRPYGGVIVWRCFVYNCMQDWRDLTTDRGRAAYDTYKPLDGAFDDNVILQIKHGPFDFQVREPISPLLLDMPGTTLALELQLAQEYTGQQIDLYAMPPMWREIFDDMGKEKVAAIAAVSNLGDDFWCTGHPFAAANLYAYGRYAWDPDLRPEDVLRDWARITYSLPEAQETGLTQLLMGSRRTYELYTATLGTCWMVTPGFHYGPNPYGYEFQSWGTYNRADRSGVGVDRTEQGTGYLLQYPERFQKLYSREHCPDDLLLFFHRVGYLEKLRDGRTLIQRIYDDHFEGYERTLKMREQLATLDLPEPDRTEALKRMALQVKNAKEWCDIVNTFFHRFSGVEDERGRTIYT